MSRTSSQRLIARLRAMGLDLPADVRVERTHAGYWQRKGGAWSWMLWSDTDSDMTKYGSQYAVTALLREPRLTVSYERRSRMWFVDPYHRGDETQLDPTGYDGQVMYVEPERRPAGSVAPGR